MSLTNKQNKYLRGLSHDLKPVVMIGNSGVTEGVLNELEARLAHHELIKVRISGVDRDERRQMAENLCKESNSELVNTIGHIAILYRQAKEPTIKLPR
ncbi:MAG: ribosome assembly RNA-binding protein YhbY [Gammaproteobacteria bacterium]|nr:ribosome assembly RNA-binding protein YhbY [Gammaproteobacteria bacterium]MCF6261865.1 ribosome assembly RNA-binding protein YhbY [Gammaproteobacteria bacterium]